MDKTAYGMRMQDLAGVERPTVAEIIEALALVGECLAEDAKAAGDGFAVVCEAATKARDLAAAVACAGFHAKHARELPAVTADQIRELVRRSAVSTDDKLFVDAVGLGSATTEAIAKRLGVLLALKPGVYVISQSWGFGQVREIDSFYGKVIIDFDGKKGHAMSLSVAGQSLDVAGEEHLLTRWKRDPEAIRALAEKDPAEIVRLALRSFGPMPIQRLQERLETIGIVAPGKWKAFWEPARRGLKADKKQPVEIPAKRTDPLRLLDAEEDFGAAWLRVFAKTRDIKAILDGVTALLQENGGTLPDSYRDTVRDRLAFALKGADRTDYPRYAQVALLLRDIGLSTPEERAKQVERLTEKEYEDDRLDHLDHAVKGLSARDVTSLIRFILEVAPDKKAQILAHVERFASVALGATLDALVGDDAATALVQKLLRRKGSPVPTLVVWAFRHYPLAADPEEAPARAKKAAKAKATLDKPAAKDWPLPPLNELITQAVHIVEHRHTGEALRMRNALQAFFDNPTWLRRACAMLTPFERQVLFERVQASASGDWDAASRRNVLVRMARDFPELAQFRRSERLPQERQHLTSERSLAAYRLAYDHLINVEIPANAKDIATARSYGDLRENAEYQFARDHQRVLLGRQDEMDRTLKALKPTAFEGVPCETVAPGTKVTLRAADGQTLAYTILGELDRDETLGIISSRSRLADLLIGKAVGAQVELPAERGVRAATIAAIEPPDAAVRAWLAEIPTEYKPAND